MESSWILWHPMGKSTPSSLSRFWTGMAERSQGNAVAVAQEGGTPLQQE